MNVLIVMTIVILETVTTIHVVTIIGMTDTTAMIVMTDMIVMTATEDILPSQDPEDRWKEARNRKERIQPRFMLAIFLMTLSNAMYKKKKIEKGDPS